MPRVVMNLHNQNLTITRPVVKSVISELLFMLEFSPIRDILYVARGRHAETKQVENSLEANKLSTDEYLEVEYEEKFIDEYRNPDQYQFEVPPIFAIPELGILVKPLCQRVSLDMTLKYTSKSYTTIMTWQAAIKRFLLNRNPFYYHDIFYTYTLPNELLAYLKQIYDLTETVAPYNRTLKQFIQTYFANGAVSVRQNINDSQRAFAIQMKNIGCLGILTQFPDSIETGKEPPKTDASFNYRIEFDLPTALILDYQHYIHNQVIDLQFLRFFQSRTFKGDLHTGLKTFSGVVNTVTDIPLLLVDQVYCEDSWTNPSQLPNYYPIVILPIQLDPLNLQLVIDFHELTNYGFPANVINSLFLYKDLLLSASKWFLYLELNEVGITTEKMAMTIDNNFIISSVYNLDLRKRHYLTIYLNTDLSQLDWKTYQGDVTNMLIILKFLYPNVNIDSLLTIIGDIPLDAIITIESINLLINTIRSNTLKLLTPKLSYYLFNNTKFTQGMNIRGTYAIR